VAASPADEQRTLTPAASAVFVAPAAAGRGDVAEQTEMELVVRRRALEGCDRPALPTVAAEPSEPESTAELAAVKLTASTLSAEIHPHSILIMFHH